MLETPERVLVVVPHPDDAERWCGGTIAKWIDQGAEVFYVLCTDGGNGSDDPNISSEDLAAIREKEQIDAASTLGVKEVVLLHRADGELEDTPEFRKELVRAIRRFRPDVLLCPDPYRLNSYWHRDHRIAGQVAADAAFPYARDHLHFRDLFTEESLEPHKTGMVLFWAADAPDTIVDIGDSMENKLKALLCHKSQFSSDGEGRAAESVRQQARQAAEGSDFQHAEAFRKIEFRR